MTDFEATGSVTLELDNLDAVGDEVAAEVEQSFGSVTIATDGGGGTGGRGQRRTRQMLRTAETQADELAEQTELLEEAVDLLDDGTGGGGGGGSGLPPGIAGGLAARGVAGAGLAGGVLAGGVIGTAVVRALQETGVTDNIENAGEFVGQTQFGDAIENTFLASGVTDFGAGVLDLAGGRDSSATEELRQRRDEKFDPRVKPDTITRLRGDDRRRFAGGDVKTPKTTPSDIPKAVTSPAPGSLLLSDIVNESPLGNGGPLGPTPPILRGLTGITGSQTPLPFGLFSGSGDTDEEPLSDARESVRNTLEASLASVSGGLFGGGGGGGSGDVKPAAITQISGGQRQQFAGVDTTRRELLNRGQRRRAFAGTGREPATRATPAAGADIDVNPTISVQVTMQDIGRLDSELDRRFKQARREIIQDVKQVLPSSLQNDFQTRTPK